MNSLLENVLLNDQAKPSNLKAKWGAWVSVDLGQPFPSSKRSPSLPRSAARVIPVSVTCLRWCVPAHIQGISQLNKTWKAATSHTNFSFPSKLIKSEISWLCGSRYLMWPDLTKPLTVCYRLNRVLSKFICWSPNLQDLSMWLYLEIGPLKKELKRKRGHTSEP